MIDTQLISKFLPHLLNGMVVSLQIAGLSCGIGFALGTVLAFASRSALTFVRVPVNAYVHIIRGIPMLIQVMVFAYALPELGLQLPIFWSAVGAIGLNSSAYICNIIRSGIASVDAGQIEAARVLGLSQFQITRYIVLPQAIATVLPALGNEFVTLTKDSSLASTIGVVELTKVGNNIRSLTLDSITVFCTVALLYLLLTTPLSLFVSYLERRMGSDALS